MRFGKTLRKSIYEPWKSDYIDYTKLKQLLRDDNPPEGESQEWTEDDEGRFVEELVNVQLEKVNAFQADTYKVLRERTSKCEATLEDSEATEKAERQGPGQDEKDDETQEEDDGLQDVLKELDSITKEINELEKYSRMNYTGFLKAVKKHDRRRGSRYKVRPLLQVRLAALPFNSEDYSPLLYRLSTMYSFIRQKTSNSSERAKSVSESKSSGDTYTSHKFWVHTENLLEVKTYILRRLPVLVYNPQTSKVVEGGHPDPTITSLYFDNSQFALYNKKLEKTSDAFSLRLRWFGQLDDKPEIFFEKKTVEESGDSKEMRFPIKEKYIQSFIMGGYKMEKSIEKLRDREGTEGNGVASLKSSVDYIQTFIKENRLQPMLRANYTRTAFQIPGDDKVRISIDTDVAFIREDSLDEDRPCRNARQWHRGDIDRLGMKYPFSEIRQGEISRFPHALLEIKSKDGSNKKTSEWISDLMSSHLLKEAPRFSKFVHGEAQLFEDYVNSFPFWLSDLETDIRKDPEAAFQEEQEKKAKQAEDELAVGSFLGSKSASSFKAAVGSPAGKAAADFGKRRSKSSIEDVADEAESYDEIDDATQSTPGVLSGFLSLSPFSNSKYARAHRQGPVQLPPGVEEPGKLIKDMNPVRVEPKVWLANQRTFVKWQHISVLLASLSLGLYNAAGEFNNVARGLAVVYTLIAVFAGTWGWWMYIVRSRMIEERSGKDFDNVIGPIIVCIGLVIALCLNFSFKYNAASEQNVTRDNTSLVFGTSDLDVADSLWETRLTPDAKIIAK
ncbi:Phosphate metabolism transcription protein [Mycoblastus sanguinarius]|nr:Phosphate metabolism transcription protein [Mycoblastus sanguinarius]